jgi:5,10-methylenetetrahydromethanopterin reductase
VFKFGIQIRPNKAVPEFVDHVKLAEEEGFDYAWIADVGLHRETFIMCALASHSTTKIRIGPGVANPYTRHPGVLAAEVATLQEISHGRSFLGLGVGGYSALRQLGIATWNRPARTLREAVVISRRLLDGEKVTYSGSIFRITNAQIDFGSRQRIPIYLGVMLGKKSLTLAGELCDGALVVGPLGRSQTKIVVDEIKKAARDSRRDMETLEIAMATPFSISRNRTEAFNTAKQFVAELAISDERLRPALLKEGVTEEQISKITDTLRRRESVQQVVTDTMVERFAVAGTPSDCIEKIELLKKTGITQIAVGRPARDLPDMVRMIGEEVIQSIH